MKNMVLIINYIIIFTVNCYLHSSPLDHWKLVNQIPPPNLELINSRPDQNIFDITYGHLGFLMLGSGGLLWKNTDPQSNSWIKVENNELQLLNSK